MAKKAQQKEEDLDIRVSGEKLDTFAVRWFKTHAVENQEDMKIVSDLTARSIDEQFYLHIPSGNTEVCAIIFYTTFLTILDFIREKQKKYNNFTIAIAKSINLGYTNNDDENNEKVGNFMPIMEYIGLNMTILSDDKAIRAEDTPKRCIEWKDLNAKQNAEYFKEIQERAYNNLKNEFRVDIRVSEAIIPIFCIFMDHVNSLLKMKFQEAQATDVSEVKMNVLGLFDVFYSFNVEDNLEIIEYQPNIMMKLALKSDSVAGRE